MSANSLLLWMSARRHGSWPQFRAAVEQLHLGEGEKGEGEDDDTYDQYEMPLYRTLRFNFQRVGHAEFFTGAGDGAEWRVTPPVLAATRHVNGWLGIVAGARSLALTERLHATIGQSANLKTLAVPAYPDQFLITAGSQGVLATIAARAGLLLQNDAPASVLTSLPTVDDPRVRHLVQLPFGSEWKIDRFYVDDLAWHPATRSEAAAASGGLFRFSLRHQCHLLFCRRGDAYRIPGQVGKYLVLKRRRRRVLRYDHQTRLLSVPASCRPPFLVERALILCSGLPPSYGAGPWGGDLQYADVPNGIAALAAALLRQE
jgi:hypothetical protein